MIISPRQAWDKHRERKHSKTETRFLIGMSTLRMEPQFMIMGQSAGTIAALALKSNGGNVHAVDADEMHTRLLQGGQLMGDACGKTPPPPPPAPPAAHNSSYTVKGAGSSDCNGVYRFDPSQSRCARHPTTANCIIIAAQIPIENHSEQGPQEKCKIWAIIMQFAVGMIIMDCVNYP